MKNAKRIIIISMLLVITLGTFSGCINSEYKQQEIINTFDSFENARDYVFVTSSPDCLYVRDNVIDLDDLTYNGAPCHYISTTTTFAYFYAYHSESKNTVDLLNLSYQTLELTFIATIKAESEITDADYYNGEVYFVEYNEDATPSKSYLIFNIETNQSRTVEYKTISKDIFENFQSKKYTVNETDRNPLSENKLEVKNNATGEKKTVGYSLLKTCEQGKTITGLGDVYATTGPIDYYEHNGEIYIVYIYLVDGFLGYPSCVYIMKYDFDSHTMQYYTSVFMENYPEGSIYDFKIPE